jgi:hypothetical protein
MYAKIEKKHTNSCQVSTIGVHIEEGHEYQEILLWTILIDFFLNKLRSKQWSFKILDTTSIICSLIKKFHTGKL